MQSSRGGEAQTGGGGTGGAGPQQQVAAGGATPAAAPPPGGSGSSSAPAAAPPTAGAGGGSSSRNATASPVAGGVAATASGTTPAAASAISRPGSTAPSTSSSSSQAAYKPLNVKDALSYLDQVKHQFQRQPQIYNSFLDIMKDFKTQNIDTPGVIQRVSTLFRGHPSLIQGFNTFLPEGYRIDCSFDPTDNGLITVTTPSGITRRDHNGVVQQQTQQQQQQRQGSQAPPAGQSQASGQRNAATSSHQQATSRPPQSAQHPPPYQQGRAGNASNASSAAQPPLRAGQSGETRQSYSSSAAAAAARAAPPVVSQGAASRASTSGNPAAATHATQGAASDGRLQAGVPAGSGSSGPATPAPSSSTAQQQRPPAEFNHAINFVNKIKNRFTRRPDTYKSFLEILQTYQKEQRPIQDVYAQVTALFRDAPDLLNEFKEFLPDTSGQAAATQQTALTAAASAPQTQMAGAGAGTPASAAAQTGTAASNPASAPQSHSQHAAAQQPSQAAAARNGRNASTVSLFGVNAGTGSQPQAGPSASYLTAGRNREGQAMQAPTLDAAASRRPVPSATPSIQGHVQAPDRTDYAQQQQQVGPADLDVDPVTGAPVAAPQSAKKRRAPAGGDKQRSKRTKHEESPDEALAANYARTNGAPAANAPLQQAAAAPLQQPRTVVAHVPPPAVQPIIIPHPLRPHGPRNQIQPLVNTEELALFDRIKKFIDDKQTYHEFLKLLNLYTQEIIDMPTLLEKAFLFIGSSDEIFGLFREFVGEQDGFVEGEEWPIDNAPALERERFELFALKSYGPSYRKLPYSESKGLACSGRDALCWSVLNDDWVAFATWASEGSGAHRKNAYEDALASSEQERHWYDVHLESIRRSIALLEPIVARITLMTSEERAQFRLKPGLGGESSSFYERMIRKIYGRDQGYEAINALYESPAVAAPIILHRLKQKDEEWNRALREWNRVWREVDAKNFYRSLDHQGITFKNNDKKVTTSKSLLAEIDTLRREQQQKRISLATTPAPPTPLRPTHQFEMHIEDGDVVFDVLKLAFSFLDRANTHYTSKERTAIENTLRRMVPLLLNIDQKEVDAQLAPAIMFDEDAGPAVASTSNGSGNGNGNGFAGAETGGESDADEMSDTGASMSDASALSTPGPSGHVNGSGKKSGKKTAADLRKKLLTTALNGHGQASSNDRYGVDDKGKGKMTTAAQNALDDARWIQASAVPWPSTAVPLLPPSTPRKSAAMPSPGPGASFLAQQNEADASSRQPARFNFFGSQPFYCFIRLFHMLYHRMSTLKQLALEVANGPDTSDRLNPYAVELGLAVPIPEIDEPGVRRGKNFYEYMLELAERFFEGEIDAHTFEENLRYMWGIKAFPAFTIDKLLASMCKHVHSINQDARCQQVLDLLKRDREETRTTVRHQIVYRHAVEQVLGSDENLFRLEWHAVARALTVQLLFPDDFTLDDPVITPGARWQYYVDSFTLHQPTEGLKLPVQAPLLARNRLPANEDAPAAVLEGRSNLGIRIGSEDYKLSYVRSTEETVFKANPDVEETEQRVRSRRRAAWEKWLLEQGEEKADKSASDISVDRQDEAPGAALDAQEELKDAVQPVQTGQPGQPETRGPQLGEDGQASAIAAPAASAAVDGQLEGPEAMEVSR